MFRKLVALGLCCSSVLQPCSVQPAILLKPEVTLDLTEEALNILMHPQDVLSLAETSFQQKCRSRVHPCEFIKNGIQHRDFWHGFCKMTLFNISENFLRSITVIPFMQEVVTSLKMNCSEYIVYRTNF